MEMKIDYTDAHIIQMIANSLQHLGYSLIKSNVTFSKKNFMIMEA